VAEHFSIKLRFDSIEEAVSWFEELRHDGLAAKGCGLRMQDLSDVEPPEKDTRLIVAEAPSEQHPWIVEPALPTKASP